MNRRVQYREHAIDVFGDLVIPKTDDRIAFRLKPPRAFRIAPSVVYGGVLRTIYLDNKTRG